MNEIRVCLVSDTIYDLNGVSRFIQDFAKEAMQKNKSFYVIGSTNKYCEEPLTNIINLKPIMSFKMPFYKSLNLTIPNYFRVKKLIKEINPDLIHIPTPGIIGVMALICAKRLNIKVVGIYHTDFPMYIYKNTKTIFLKNLTIKILKRFYRDFEAIFLRSDAYFDILQKELNFSKSRLFNFSPGIDLEKFDKRYKNLEIWDSYNIDKNSFKVLYTGRVSVEKNIDKLIKIWERLAFFNISLILVGDIEIEIDKIELKSRKIYLLGKKERDELSKIYASSDCFIFPSTTDTLGQVVMEAMSSGLPVIVSNKGGPKSFVDKSRGYVIDMNSEEDLEKAIRELSKKDEVYKNKSEKAYNFMRDKSISHSFDDFWEINKKMVN